MTTTDLDVVPTSEDRAQVTMDPDEMTRLMYLGRGLALDLGHIPSRNRAMKVLRVGPAKADWVIERLRAESPATPQSGGGYDDLGATAAYPLVIEAPSSPAEVDTEPAPTEDRKLPSAWPLVFIAAGAFVTIWSGWVGLGELAGFGVVRPLPGLPGALGRFQLNTAITLPIGVEAYATYALRVWLSPWVSARTRSWAKWSTLASLTLGLLGQFTYHLMTARHIATAPVFVVVGVSSIPIVALGAGAALAHLISGDRRARA